MKWKTLAQEYLIKNKWLTVRKDEVQLPNDKILDDFFVLEYPDWINVIAITGDGHFIIEKQYRHGIGEECYEICAGVIESNEKPFQAAQRELLEESGYGEGNWSLYMESSPNSNSMTNRCYTFLATGVRKVCNPVQEDSECIEILLLTKEQVLYLLHQNKILEGVMSAPLWKYFLEGNLK